MRNTLPSVAAFACLALVAACGDDGADAGDTDATDVAGDTSDTRADGSDAPDVATDATADSVADAGDATTDATQDADASPDVAADVVETRWYSASETLTGREALVYVDPFIGTGGTVFAYAALSPAAQVPNGFVKVGPDSTNRGFHAPNQHFSGYNAYDPDVRGFSHIRLIGTGAADMGLLRVLPLAAVPTDTMPPMAFAAIDKSTEVATPGYYRVEMPGEGVVAEMTASGWAAIHRYSYSGDAALVFDATASVVDTRNLDARVEVTPAGFSGELTYAGGFATRARPFTVYFDAALDPPADRAHIWSEDAYLPEETEGSGERVGGVFEWDDPAQLVELRIGLSLVDAEAARVNREGATFETTLERMRDDAESLWVDKLDNVEVGGGTDDLRTVFFTAQYNAYRMPSRLDEPDGRYRGVDGEVHVAVDHAYYSDMSLWDSFRTVHPWYELTDPEVARDCVLSLQRMYEQSGRFPRWPAMLGDTGSMLGSPAAIVVSGAALKGITGPDYAAALDGLIASDYGRLLSDDDTRGRDDVEDYVSLGYVPSDRNESVSLTLEYAWADHAIGRLARLLERDDADLYLGRGRSFAALFDEELAFFVPRSREGAFETTPLRSVYMGNGPYTEGSAWHWRFYGLHEPTYLAELYGQDVFGEELDRFFDQSPLGRSGMVDSTLPDPYYWHGNEPTIHAVYLFAYSDRPERGHYWQREIQTRIYRTGVDGLPGNDDGGTMSSWFLFSAMGLYPIAGTEFYIPGSPIFSRVVVRDGVNVTTVRADGADLETRYVSALTRDGAAVTSPQITHEELVGSELVFTMGDAP
jgi:predicted alpha-1,2-mannosidase